MHSNSQNNNEKDSSLNLLCSHSQKHRPTQSSPGAPFSPLLPAVPAAHPGHGFGPSTSTWVKQHPFAPNITTVNSWAAVEVPLCLASPKWSRLPVGVSEAQGGVSLQGLPHYSHPIREPVQAAGVEAKSAIGHVPLKEEEDANVWSKASLVQSHRSYPGKARRLPRGSVTERSPGLTRPPSQPKGSPAP